MLGRREEEIEREEVDRQLREVDLQERMAVEAEEQERIARARDLGEPEEGRDLDEDIPDADEDGLADGDSGEDGEDAPDPDDEFGMGGDLDDEIPDADDPGEDDEADELISPAGADGLWVYDTRREPDTDDEDQLPQSLQPPRHSGRRHGRHEIVAGVRLSIPGSEPNYDERDVQDLADSMLDDGDNYDHDIQHSARGIAAEERDLDDDVPDADDDQAWEHTDTELEESEMDISILPSQGPIQQGRAGIAEVQSRGSPARGPATAPRSSGVWASGHSPSPIAAPQHFPPPMQAMPRQRGIAAAAATPEMGATSSPYTPRSASMRAARIVSGNRQRPYNPDRTRPRPPPARHQLQQVHTPTAEMLDTPPLAATVAQQDNEEEVDTDIEGDEDDQTGFDTGATGNAAFGIGTPDPFTGPGIVPAQVGRGLAPEQRRPPAGARADAQVPRDGNTRRTANPSPSRTAAARNWLDGAAAAIGVGGSRDAGTVAGGAPTARRTLFQRATRRREPEAQNTPAEVNFDGEASTRNAGSSSGGIFSSPDLAALRDAGDGFGSASATGDGETPDMGGADPAEDPARRIGRRRSGRFLGGRRRGAE
jgi:hypothetical protein